MKALKRVCVSVLLVFFRVQLLNPLRYIYFGIYTLVLFSTLSMIAGSDRALRGCFKSPILCHAEQSVSPPDDLGYAKRVLSISV
jgi:hypothetical protein